MIGGGNNFRGKRTRWRKDDGGDEGLISAGGAEYEAALDTDITAFDNAKLHLRFTARQSAGNISRTVSVYYRLNLSDWFLVSLVSLPVYAATTNRYAPGTATTLHADQLEVPGSEDWAGDLDNGAAFGGNILANNRYDSSGGPTRLEHEITMQLGGPGQLSADDILDFRFRIGVSPAEEGYDYTARVTIIAEPVGAPKDYPRFGSAVQGRGAALEAAVDIESTDLTPAVQNQGFGFVSAVSTEGVDFTAAVNATMDFIPATGQES